MLTPEQCRAARAWLNMSQEDLALNANVSLSTVRDFESETREPIANNVEALARVFAVEGFDFFSEAAGPRGFRYVGRIKERDTYPPALDILSKQPDGFMKTAELIRELERHFRPRGEDAEILEGRSDTRFSQIVRNIISHRTTPTNLIGAGWASYDKAKRGLRITQEGREYLSSVQEKQKT